MFYSLFFHFSLQAVWKNAVKKGVLSKKNAKTKDKEEYDLICELMALSYMPLDKIKETYEQIKQKALLRKKKEKNWEKFFKYFENTWFKRFQPELWCVFNVHERTNNPIESYHSKLAPRKVGTRMSANGFIGMYEYIASLARSVYIFW